MDKDPAKALALLEGAVDKYVKQQARSTIARNVEHDEARVGYARVAGPDSCEFCQMQSSRGFAFSSASAAHADDGFHPHCSCGLAVAFKDKKGRIRAEGVDGETPDDWDPYELYEQYAESGRTFKHNRARENAARRRARQDNRPTSTTGELFAERKRAKWVEDKAAMTVDIAKIESKDYSGIMKRAVGAKPQETVLSSAKRMLRHRSGTSYEDLYAIDITKGDLIDSVTNSKTPKKVVSTTRMRKRMQERLDAGHEIITLHNHPESLIPSPEDIRALELNGSSYGLIACHDGTVFKYSIVGKPCGGLTLEDMSHMYYTRIAGKSEVEVLKTIENQIGVRIEHFS